MTLLLCDKGFNENETKLLRHLIHNKCELIIVRTFCGQAVENMVADAEDQVFRFFGYVLQISIIG